MNMFECRSKLKENSALVAIPTTAEENFLISF